MISRPLVITILFFLSFVSFGNTALSYAAGPENYFYRVYFSDKGDAVVSDYHPQTFFLSGNRKNEGRNAEPEYLSSLTCLSTLNTSRQ